LLECIGAIEKDKKDGTETAYQDSVKAPIGCEYDDDDNNPDPPPPHLKNKRLFCERFHQL
jgi:hypothetical protein